MTMKRYNAKQLSEIIDVSQKHMWKEVRGRGIHPVKVGNCFTIDENQLALLLERIASGYRERQKPSPSTFMTKSSIYHAELEPAAINGHPVLIARATHPVPKPWKWGE